MIGLSIHCHQVLITRKDSPQYRVPPRNSTNHVNSISISRLQEYISTLLYLRVKYIIIHFCATTSKWSQESDT